MGSPLGRYSDVAATIVGVGVVAVWLILHAIIAAAAISGHVSGPLPDTSQVDLAGALALGVILGQRATTNGATQVAQSANLRLDAIGAPSAAAATAAIAASPVVPPGAPGPLG